MSRLSDETMAAGLRAAIKLRDGELPTEAELAMSLRQWRSAFARLSDRHAAWRCHAALQDRRCRIPPWVSMFVVMSAAVLVPLFIVLFGTGFVFRTAIVFMASVWYITLTVYQGVASLSSRHVDVARSFGAGRARIFFR